MGGGLLLVGGVVADSEGGHAVLGAGGREHDREPLPGRKIRNISYIH